MFSFYLSKGSGSEGFLKIGGYDLEKYAKSGSKPEDIVWTSLIDDGPPDGPSKLHDFGTAIGMPFMSVAFPVK